jgi:hypothetical protein
LEECEKKVAKEERDAAAEDFRHGTESDGAEDESLVDAI